MKKLLLAVIILGLFSCEEEQIFLENEEYNSLEYSIESVGDCNKSDTIVICVNVVNDAFNFKPPTLKVNSDSLNSFIYVTEEYDNNTYDYAMSKDETYVIGTTIFDNDKFFNEGFVKLRFVYKDSTYIWSRPIKVKIL